MKVYLVGGAVRDQLLELPYKERDWVVVGATPEEMLAQGYRRADRDFPVFLHPQSGEEYALARTEVKAAPGYKGFELSYGPEVTLEQDLLRRDLTINALAMDESGRVIDVCEGQKDLQAGLLRHITPAFTEDPLRLLRIARFAAKLGCWGFRVAHGTHALMKQMATTVELETLSAERFLKEMSRAMGEPQPWRFFEVLQRCGALQKLLPEVAEIMDRESAGHGVQTAGVMVSALKRIVPVSDDPLIRAAVALFFCAQKQPDLAAWLEKIRLDKRSGQLLSDLLQLSSVQTDDMSGERLFDLVSQLKPRQQPQRYEGLLLAAEALWPEPMALLKPRLSAARQALLAPLPEPLTASSLQGKALGEAIRRWRLDYLQQLEPPLNKS
ncbi:MAG: multifunctional CCA tRNA nucleotidyl transferase/2'3'-cyclic phosphodiesterase/2'nucleotidase/phosphatase [Candidatus Thiodiazotropha sp.]